MIDQSHNLKGKIEAMVQTVVTAQELYLKAALVDREQLAELAAVVRPGGCRRALPRRVLDATCVRSLQRGARRADCLPIRWRPCAKADMWSARRASAEAGSSAVSSYA